MNGLLTSQLHQKSLKGINILIDHVNQNKMNAWAGKITSTQVTHLKPDAAWNCTKRKEEEEGKEKSKSFQSLYFPANAFALHDTYILALQFLAQSQVN